jgi:hypothetical protein
MTRGRHPLRRLIVVFGSEKRPLGAEMVAGGVEMVAGGVEMVVGGGR